MFDYGNGTASYVIDVGEDVSCPTYLNLNSRSAFAMLIGPEYQPKPTWKLTSRLRTALLPGSPQEGSNCVDSLAGHIPRWDYAGAGITRLY